jgi:MFS-type transporter involved in bile tolerance (Atg22 family)
MLHKQGDPHRNSDFPSNDHRNSWDGLSALPPQDPKTSSGGGQAYLHEGSRLLSDSFGFLFHDRKTSLILFTFFANTIGNAVLSVGVQYISTRFYVTIAEANLLFSLRAAFNAILFIFILPSILYLLRKKSKSKSLHTLTPTPTTAHQDLLLAQLSVVFLPLGYFFMALASNIPLMTTGMLIMTLGTGHASLMRALVTELFEERHIARLYAAITIFETLGSILSGPLLAGLLSWGLQMQGVAMGMPFFAAAGMTLLVAVLTWRVRIPLKRRQCERGEESDEEVEEEEERAEEAEGR